MSKNKLTLGIDCDDTLWQLDCYYDDVKKIIADYITSFTNTHSTKGAIDLLEYHSSERIKYQGFGYIMLEHAAICTLAEVKGTINKQDIDFIKNECHKIADLDLTPYDGVVETLEILSKEYHLIAMTKGHPGEQLPKIEKSGLSHFFDDIEIMYDKSSLFYQSVLKKYRIDLNRFYMIENSLNSDILPVVNIGGKAIHIPCPHFNWVHDTANENDAKEKEFISLDKFSDLPNYLKNLA